MSKTLSAPYYIGLAAVALLLYINFMSPSLDDFDAFSFAFALENWQHAFQEVQAPGFPVYLYSARFFALLTGNTLWGLTLVSALSGALGLVCVAWIGDGLGFPRAGMLAAILLLFMPGYWLHSEYALSDMPGLAIMLGAIAFLLHSTERRAYCIVGCLLTGLALGLRPHNALPMALAGIYALWLLWQNDEQRVGTILIGFAVGLLGIALWLVPITMAFDGLGGYLDSITAHSQHIQRSDSIVSATNGGLRLRAEAFLEGWSHLLAGGGTLSLLVIASVMLVGLVRIPWQRPTVWFLIAWLGVSSTKIFLLASLERPRLFLPALVPLVLLTAIGYLQYRNRWLRLVPVLLLVLLLARSAPLVFRLNTELSAPVQAINYIQATYPVDESSAVVVSQGSFKAADYYLGQYHQMYTPFFTPEDWSAQITDRQPDYIFVLDGDDIAPTVFDTITAPYDYVSIDDRVFERDRRVFPQHVTVRLQVFIPRDQLQPEQLPLPIDGEIAAGEPGEGKFFGDGFYRIELLGDIAGRWSDQVATMRVALPVANTDVTFLATPYLGGQEVEIVVNDTVLTTLPLNEVWGEYSFSIPASAIEGYAVTEITLSHTLAEFPENHNRRLAAGYSIFTFRQE